MPYLLDGSSTLCIQSQAAILFIAIFLPGILLPSPNIQVNLMNIKSLNNPISQPSITVIEKKVRHYLFDIALLLVVGLVLYYGSYWKSLDLHSAAAQQTDVARYECYTVAFWQGLAALHDLPEQQCTFITHPTATTHVLSTADILQK